MQAPHAAIDREKVCPLLLRCFWKGGRGNTAVDYKESGHGAVPQNEIQIYTWPDATLREITDLVKDVILQSVKQKHLSLTYALVYPDREGRFVLRTIGKLASFRGGPDDSKTLGGVNFQTGDYLDIMVDTTSKGNSAGGRPDPWGANGRDGARGRGNGDRPNGGRGFSQNKRQRNS